jgi:hypothetical protein
LSEPNEQALRFVIAAGSATQEQIEMGALAATRSVIFEGFPLSGMTGSNYAAQDLAVLGLIQRQGDGYSASEQGRSVINYLDSSDSELPTPAETNELLFLVGSPSDPRFYGAVLETLSKMESVLLVDPFLAVADLNVIAQVGKVDRILTGSQPVLDRGEKRNDLQACLVGLRIAGGINPHVDLRTSAGIHDRYALPAKGKGYMIGASMGSKKVTALVELSEPATKKLLHEHSEIWSAAETIQPLSAPFSA